MRINIASGVGAAERWRKQYENADGREWPSTITGSSRAIYDKLVALGARPSPEQVASVIGNEGWSFIRCSGCEQYVKLVVEYGTGESAFTLCRVCLTAGSTAVEALAQFRDTD